jgi:hypothetical protein
MIQLLNFSRSLPQDVTVKAIGTAQSSGMSGWLTERMGDQDLNIRNDPENQCELKCNHSFAQLRRKVYCSPGHIATTEEENGGVTFSTVY